MEHPLPEKSIITLGAWLESPAGSYVRAWEQARLNALTADIFGFNAVQIGLPQIHALEASRMPNKWLTDMHLPQAGAPSRNVPLVVVHDFSELPFQSQSLDLVVLPHGLEFAAEPHQLLREVERVLIPEGQAIICGFNPASLWGMRQVAGRLTGAHFLPQNGEFIGMPRLKDWLKLLNMEVNRGHFGCYVPPFNTEKWLGRFVFMEKAGDRWWPYLGAVYIVQAIKRIKGMRLIGPAKVKQVTPTSQAVPAANKTRHYKIKSD
jgi:SAM-dependent methyltransferase